MDQPWSKHPLAFPVRVFALRGEQVTKKEVAGTQVNEAVQVIEDTSAEEWVSVCRLKADQELTLILDTKRQEAQLLTVQDSNGASVLQVTVSTETDCCRVGTQSFLIPVGNLSAVLQFKTPTDRQAFCTLLNRGGIQGDHKKCENAESAEQPNGQRAIKRDAEESQAPSRRPCSVYDRRIEDCSATQFFQFHGCLSQQQNMLQDYLRTATYHRAILLNDVDFRDKVVLNVGCGSGILSFFAIQAGAARVYAVEASPMAKYAQLLVEKNCLSERIVVLEGKVEEITCPDMVDVIISEPIGHMLLNEGMLESFLYARKWLKPNGLMFPTAGDIHVAPFTDEQLYVEHYARASFWQQRCFFGINLSGLHSTAVDEFFRQPIVDTFDMQILMARSVKHRIDFMQATDKDLHRLEIPFVFKMLQPGLVHGLAFWFDVAFLGSSTAVWLSTAPTEPITHWYQVRCLLQTPLFAKLGQTLSGTILLTANTRQSYDIHITATVDQSGFRSGNTLDLKDLFFRYA